MEHTTSLTELVKKWWYLKLTDEQHISLHKKHFPEMLFSDLTWENVETIYLKEHPTEAEVTKEVNYREVAEKLFKKTLHENLSPYDAIIKGMKWQKEKDRALIEELLRVLKLRISPMTPKVNMDIIHEETEGAIIKAEKHLNNQ